MSTVKHATNGSQRDEAAFELLEQMYQDHLAGPEIYHASKFWEKLNQLNIEWLKNEGLENFKRTVNNNYFNWMVTTRSVYFRNVFNNYIAVLRRHPTRIREMISAGIGEMHHRTYTSSITKASYVQRKIYALYLLFLHEFVKQRDEFGLFQELEEPKIGNPITINIRGKRVSQDIANSYMEYSYIRSSLGSEFPKVKKIAEIGGGYGRLAYLFHHLHQSEGVKIILIDLPPALLVAQWYLRQAFPDAKMMTYRSFKEFSEIEEEFESSSICFLLPHQLELLPKHSIDLLINVSSLQEMNRRQINRYYELIDEKTKYFYTKQWVCWDNAEDKMSVPAVIYPTRPDWELKGGRLNPIHTEFFEAMFKVR